ncbi:cytochrome c oxidase, subunit VIb [Rhizophagus irregularis]|uniref:Cytochrome c oxidase subunit n=3 Tax=Rhizophagus irregularis TaxID=588596 RepID=A0A2I1DXT5_9GLOM|nr:cytochrome c oxidase, subunit VIb [Rhizophagus irregularis DAOM 181602=DAOM 197198]EXX69637.1 cytochrome c oxidase subunit VIb [Rhizophagus irregularis DAOM 197198w]PKC16258.1 cytochrome c oxidase, subunit VIb [Rhizophagus irregularis]PKK73395.1 cytochrome c oxidase, subunit VIb [Rhizophagus irregularis]PKY14679.1 cytochrome c oxidase, subunit VIb [Rhizophagus irregularis]POG79664.1 cytochrome c oxidase, subunit VIb [Rhizophagus irregularis DAOM 181602=DAOM 197198]|eukprot:XP_025186530.1 cytochrome c oxidase, subunit VIb [Rhizophagus irregularis DAOM 181602=DAOM 197198]
MSDNETETKAINIRTAGFDARFPNTNQTKHCWQNYVDYFKCIKARGEDFAPCQQFFRAYHSLCPNDFISKWDTQREEGNFPVKLDP